jgi:acyl-CoA thioesterase
MSLRQREEIQEVLPEEARRHRLRMSGGSPASTHRTRMNLRNAMANNLESIKHHFENDRFATSSGMTLVELRPGFAKTCLQVEERHLNSVGTVQGGAIFTLAAFAFGAASKTEGRVTVGVSTNISFVKATRSGTLYAEATEVSRSRRISTCTARVTNDAGDLVALFQGTAYIKNEPFPSVHPAEE